MPIQNSEIKFHLETILHLCDVLGYVHPKYGSEIKYLWNYISEFKFAQKRLLCYMEQLKRIKKYSYYDLLLI